MSKDIDWIVALNHATWVKEWAKKPGRSAMIVLTDGSKGRTVITEGMPEKIGEAIGKEACKNERVSEVLIMASDTAMSETDTRTPEALEEAFCRIFEQKD